MTLIDRIQTNNFIDGNYATGIIKTDITDHFPIFLKTNIKTKTCKTENIKIYKRQFSETNTCKFRKLLTEMNWDLITETNDVDGAYELFLNIVHDSK